MIGWAFRLFTAGSSLPWIIGGVMLAVTTGYAWLKIHEYNIWEQATLAFNQAQEQLTQQKQEEFVQKTEVINDNAARIRETIARREDQMNEISSGIEKQAITEHKGTEQASKYLKNIIYQLDQNYGAKK
jgi:hypothetical protein